MANWKSRKYGVGALALALLVPALAGCGTSGSVAPASKSFKNPVFKGDFPDPFIMKVGTTYYAYATQLAGRVNIQLLHSQNLVHWNVNGDAMPVTATWVTSNTWAPEVIRRYDGKYVMYYTGHDSKTDKQCVGYAIAGSPTGPFRDPMSKPFLCQAKLGGTIDPNVLRDSNGQMYLYYKNDGNCCGLDTVIWGQKLSADGTKLLGKAARLEVENEPWEGQVTEGPTMWKHGNQYYLFYSANRYDSSDYAVGYATCKSPMGPCTDARENPILKSRCRAAGPGGQTLFVDHRGQTWIMYHAWPPNNIGYPGSSRMLWMDRLDWINGKPVVKGPTCTSEPMPAP